MIDAPQNSGVRSREDFEESLQALYFRSLSLCVVSCFFFNSRECIMGLGSSECIRLDQIAPRVLEYCQEKPRILEITQGLFPKWDHAAAA